MRRTSILQPPPLQLPNGSVVELDEIAFNLRSYPLNLSSFVDFLKNESAEENILFFLEAEAYMQHVTNKTTEFRGMVVKLPNPNPALSSSDWGRQIIEDWIGPHAKKSTLNIGEKLTRELVNSVGNDVVDFRAAQTEARRMLENDRLRRFIAFAAHHNISTSEAVFRLKVGVFAVLASVLWELLLRYLTSIPRGAVFGLALPSMVTGTYMFWSGRARTFVVLPYFFPVRKTTSSWC